MPEMTLCFGFHQATNKIGERAPPWWALWGLYFKLLPL